MEDANTITYNQDGQKPGIPRQKAGFGGTSEVLDTWYVRRGGRLPAIQVPQMKARSTLRVFAASGWLYKMYCYLSKHQGTAADAAY